MAAPTESPEIAHAIRAKFARTDVVYVALAERDGPTAMLADAFIALPHLAACIGPYLSRLPYSGHILALLGCALPDYTLLRFASLHQTALGFARRCRAAFIRNHSFALPHFAPLR